MKRALTLALLTGISCTSARRIYPLEVRTLNPDHLAQHHHAHHQRHSQFVEVTNNLSTPVMINFTVSKEEGIGYYGYLVHPNTQQELDLHEFGWFAPVAAGGFGKVREGKIMEILKHAFADKAEIIIPDEETRTMILKKDHNEIIIEKSRL